MVNPENILFENYLESDQQKALQAQLKTERKRYLEFLKSTLKNQLPNFLKCKRDFLKEIKNTREKLRFRDLNQQTETRSKKIKKEKTTENQIVSREFENGNLKVKNEGAMEEEALEDNESASMVAEKGEENDDSVFLSENDEVEEEIPEGGDN